MSVRIAGLTGATLERTPTVCHDVHVVAVAHRRPRARTSTAGSRRPRPSSAPGGRSTTTTTAARSARCSTGRRQLFPRAAELPAGPPSDDAVLVTCAYLVDRSSPWVLQSLFLAAIGEAKDKGAAALETFAYRYPEGESDYERFLVHRTVFPHDFLADFGFRIDAHLRPRRAGAAGARRARAGARKASAPRCCGR